MDLNSLSEVKSEYLTTTLSSNSDYESDLVTNEPKEHGDVRSTVVHYMDALRPFWWLYLTLLLILTLMIFYAKRDVILDRCRKKDPRDNMTRLDVSAYNVEVLVTCRPPPSYDQAMGIAPQGPPPHQLPPKHPPLPEEHKMPDAFSVWIG